MSESQPSMNDLVIALLEVADFELVPGRLSPTEQDYQRVAHELGIRFPDDYRALMKQLDGIDFKNWELFRVLGADDADYRHCDIVRENQSARERWDMPAYLVTFYTNGLADQTCFDTRVVRDQHYRITEFKHDADEWPEAVEDAPTVASTFTEWLRQEIALLRELKEDKY